eukprot:8467213-Ditylum_brightwellii.AAC.2
MSDGVHTGGDVDEGMICNIPSLPMYEPPIHEDAGAFPSHNNHLDPISSSEMSISASIASETAPSSLLLPTI